MTMSKEIMLKSVVALAKGYFDKNPNQVVTISAKEITKYVNDNYKEFEAVIETDENDTRILLKAKSK